MPVKSGVLELAREDAYILSKIPAQRGEVHGADKPEYWNVGIVEYWGTTTKSLEMGVPQESSCFKPIIP
jgi:hypothetical protein